MWPRQILELGKQFNLMIRLQNILKASLQDVLKMSWRHLGKTSSEDEWLRRIYSSWSRRLEDVFKTSSEDEDERRLQDVFIIKTNVCWVWSYEWNLIVWTNWIIFYDTHFASWNNSTLFFWNKNFKVVNEKFHRISRP